MFQLKDIKDAHSKVKTGADFPVYIQDLIKLGVIKYDTFVNDGHAIFFGADDYQIQSEPKYSVLIVADKSDEESFKNNLKIHQQGQTDYLTFCKHSAEAGIEKWTVEMKSMTCTYYDKSNHKMLEEKIPVV
jgi:uncharacterized protein YbcV (DUF1398 family)